MKMYTRPEIQMVACETETIMLSSIAPLDGHQGGADGATIKGYTINWN